VAEGGPAKRRLAATIKWDLTARFLTLSFHECICYLMDCVYFLTAAECSGLEPPATRPRWSEAGKLD
jgi:hypothetical protein